MVVSRDENVVAQGEPESREAGVEIGDEENTDSPAPFPIVGIGASAGGLAAFEAFFSGIPVGTEPNMAFVLIQHLAPDHHSILSELVSRYTRMRVFEVEDGMPVQANCVYVIPPGFNMALFNGALQLLEPTEPRGQRLAVDFFFRSLADDQGSRAVGIILSGTGSDGTLGVRAIKGVGGMVMVQTPASAEFDAMPHNALATGLVDYEIPADEMIPRLMAYVASMSGRLIQPGVVPSPSNEGAMKAIFVLLRAQVGHDFSQYKPSTIHRRIERRMAVNQIEGLADYVSYLQRTPTEVEALFRDLLIGVTRFFRDPEAFVALEQQVIPKLFEGRAPGDAVRVWTAGCSTGEEAYSLAILFLERMEALKINYSVQLFATDIDPSAIAVARAGVYPASIAADVSPERLTRYFILESDGSAYRIHKRVRDLLVFSEQNLIKDPPFSRLDLISCRNLLIYFDLDLQKQLIPLFYYALNPNAWLFLGSSEGVGEFGELFGIYDRKAKVYQRRNNPLNSQRLTFGRFLPPIVAGAPLIDGAQVMGRQSSITAKPAFPAAIKGALREITENALISAVVAAGILVNKQGDILYLHGRTGLFLEPAEGEAGINNVHKMAREGLRQELFSALHRAVNTKEPVNCPGLWVKTNGHYTAVNLAIRIVSSGVGASIDAPLYLVILKESLATQGLSSAPDSTDHGVEGDPETESMVYIAKLKAELRAKEEYLQAANEGLASSTEEMKSANEEMQSVNEELQSSNEELETSKEELQSVNEELATVNAELQTKVIDLSRANNDMNNLLAGTGIATVFVDHQLRILRFTPAASDVINLILSDVGRPLAHIVSNLVDYTDLVGDVQSVLATLVSKEVEVQTANGRSYTMRIQPYRTLDNVIEGAVISFVDITDFVHVRTDLAIANDLFWLAVVVRDAHDAITLQDLTGRTLAWNPGAVRLYGWTEAEALNLNAVDRIPVALREDALATLVRLSRAEILEPHNTQRLTKTGAVLNVSIISTALVDEAGQIYAIATTERVNNGGKL